MLVGAGAVGVVKRDAGLARDVDELRKRGVGVRNEPRRRWRARPGRRGRASPDGALSGCGRAWLDVAGDVAAALLLCACGAPARRARAARAASLVLPRRVSARGQGVSRFERVRLQLERPVERANGVLVALQRRGTAGRWRRARGVARDRSAARPSARRRPRRHAPRRRSARRAPCGVRIVGLETHGLGSGVDGGRRIALDLREPRDGHVQGAAPGQGAGQRLLIVAARAEATSPIRLVLLCAQEVRRAELSASSAGAAADRLPQARRPPR